MKKLNLNRNTFAGGETLTRKQLKKIMGGGGYETTGPGCGESTGDDRCIKTYFWESSAGCGTVKCTGYFPNGECDCWFQIDTPQPCGYA